MPKCILNISSWRFHSHHKLEMSEKPNKAPLLSHSSSLPYCPFYPLRHASVILSIVVSWCHHLLFAPQMAAVHTALLSCLRIAVLITVTQCFPKFLCLFQFCHCLGHHLSLSVSLGCFNMSVTLPRPLGFTVLSNPNRVPSLNVNKSDHISFSPPQLVQYLSDGLWSLDYCAWTLGPFRSGLLLAAVIFLQSTTRALCSSHVGRLPASRMGCCIFPLALGLYCVFCLSILFSCSLSVHSLLLTYGSGHLALWEPFLYPPLTWSGGCLMCCPRPLVMLDVLFGNSLCTCLLSPWTGGFMEGSICPIRVCPKRTHCAEHNVGTASVSWIEVCWR